MTEWQPITWRFLHTITLDYNNEFKNKFIDFFNTLKVIIPCKICRGHYIENINLENDNLFNMTIDLHNNVNKMNNKNIWSYTDSYKHYKQHGFTDNLMQTFIMEYVRHNFLKGYDKTENLIKMLNVIGYTHPDENKRNRLVNFSQKMTLKRKNIKNWLYTFFILLSK